MYTFNQDQIEKLSDVIKCIRSPTLMRILDHIIENDGCTARNIYETLRMCNMQTYGNLAKLTSFGLIISQGTYNKKRYFCEETGVKKIQLVLDLSHHILK